ncbi:MAG: cryptochrome/photolyase family protein, partial [Streptomyces albidoflavus]
SDYCSPCAYRPDHRTGDRACPYTAGYWTFVHRHHDRLVHNPRTAQAARGMERLTDLDEVVRQEEARGDGAP